MELLVGKVPSPDGNLKGNLKTDKTISIYEMRSYMKENSRTPCEQSTEIREIVNKRPEMLRFFLVFV